MTRNMRRRCGESTGCKGARGRGGGIGWENRVARRGNVIINYMAQDGPDLVVRARVLPHRVDTPTDGTEICLRRAIRYMSSHPRGVSMFPRSTIDDTLRMWTDSDWAGDVMSRRSCSGGHIQRIGGTICHGSETQANVALFSGEDELKLCDNCRRLPINLS